MEFGAPLEALGLEVEDLHHSGTVLQFGLPPRRIDILTQISGVEFAEAWDGRSTQTIHGLELPFLGRVHFERNKKASGRPKDLADIALLDEVAGD